MENNIKKGNEEGSFNYYTCDRVNALCPLPTLNINTLLSKNLIDSLGKQEKKPITQNHFKYKYFVSKIFLTLLGGREGKVGYYIGEKENKRKRLNELIIIKDYGKEERDGRRND